VSIFITGEYYEDIAGSIDHIAKQLDWSEQQVIDLLRQQGEITHTTKRPDNSLVPLEFGGPNAIRSYAKSAPVLWALATNNDHVLSAPYNDVRRFIVEGDLDFAREKSHLDLRQLPDVERLIGEDGPLFNLIYIRSDAYGRVTAYFSLYNIVGWQMVLRGPWRAAKCTYRLNIKPDNAGVVRRYSDSLDLALSWFE
jgi:hypothetical protein